MARQDINIGSAINAGDGEAIRNAFQKINAMMAEIYSYLVANGFNPSFIANGALPLAKLETIATDRVVGNLSGGPSSPSVITLTDIANAIPVAGIETISGAKSVAAADRGKLFLATATLTMSLGAAATLGAGYLFRIKNNGTGIVTIDPNGAETINGSTTVTVPPKAEATVISDGTGWHALGMSPQVLLASGSVSAAATLDLALLAGYSSYRCILRNFEPSTSNTALTLRGATDGVPNFLATASYRYAGLGLDQAATSNNIGNGASSTTSLALNNAQLSAAGYASLFDVMINPGSSNQPCINSFATYTKHTTTYVALLMASGAIETGSRLTHVRFLYSSGNIATGSYELYGLRN